MSYDLLKVTDQELATLRQEYDLGSGQYHADAYGEQVTYMNRWSAVRIRLEYRDARVFVSLFRLGEKPLPLHWDLDARERDPLNGFDLEDLIAIRSSANDVKQVDLGPISPAELRRTIQEYAVALRIHAGDVLRGDFSVFLDLARLVARRIDALKQKGHPLGPEIENFLNAYRKLEQH